MSETADEIVTALYRRFKDWSKRGFGPDDVTWCEVRADVLALISDHLAKVEAAREAALARVGELQAVLERIKFLAGDPQSPVMDAWDRARQALLDGSQGSMPRDIMEAGLCEIWEVAAQALRPEHPPAQDGGGE